MGLYSNGFIYENGKTVDFIKPVIHLMNKQNFIYNLNPKENKKNVIMMGDMIEDSNMVRERHHDAILKIGYLNDLKRNKHLLTHYLKTFDIVVTGDGTLHIINYLLQKMFLREVDRSIHEIMVETEGFDHIEKLFA